MRFKSSILIISLVLFALTLTAQNRTIDIKIKQGRNYYNLLELDSLVLKKKKFVYICTLSKDSTIHLHHSLDDSLFQLFKDRKIKKVDSWPYHMMAEEQFNSDYELIVSNDGWCSWFYSRDINWHRFDAKGIRFKNNQIIGTKTIRRFLSLPERKTIDVQNWDRPIYVIIAESKDSNNLIGEVQYAHVLKLLFRD